MVKAVSLNKDAAFFISKFYQGVILRLLKKI